MRYEGSVYRPPSEAYSYILQVTVGCSHNKCTFCSMFKEKQFHLRPMQDVLDDLAMARRYYSVVDRIFLADGDALCLTNKKLMIVLDRIHELFPECERVSIYGSPRDVLRKTPEELAELRDAGIGIIYIGAESGSDKVLRDVCKGATRAEIIEAVKRVEDADIRTSVTFISGLAGAYGWEEHAVACGTMISEMQPSYVGLLTLMVEPDAPMYKDVSEGKFQFLTPYQVLQETALLLENCSVQRKCVFRSNHASNYVSLRGDLPEDRDKMIAQLKRAMNDSSLWKDDRYRML